MDILSEACKEQHLRLKRALLNKERDIFFNLFNGATLKDCEALTDLEFHFTECKNDRIDEKGLHNIYFHLEPSKGNNKKINLDIIQMVRQELKNRGYEVDEPGSGFIFFNKKN